MEPQEHLAFLTQNLHDVVLWGMALEPPAGCYASPALARWMGAPSTEAPLTLRGWLRRVAPEDRALAFAETQRLFERGQTQLVYRWLLTDGTRVPILERRRVVKNAEGRPIWVGGIAIAHPPPLSGLDPSSRHDAGQAFREAIERVHDGVAITTIDPEGSPPRIEYVNPAFCEMTGYSPAELLGQSPDQLAGRLFDSNALEQAREALGRGKPFDAEAVYFRKKGDPYVVKSRIEPVSDAAGRPSHWISVHRDVTDQRRQQEFLRQRERLASIGTLAAGIAHEINNPVGSILLAADAGLRFGLFRGDNEFVFRALGDIKTDAERCGRIVKDILRFARQEPSAPRVCDLNDVVQSAVQLMRREASRRNARLEFVPGTGLPSLSLSVMEIRQAFVNLIQNALESRAQTIRLTTWLEADQAKAVITVADDGRGIAADDLPRIFDPFYTTRRLVGGTGLGLSLVHGIIAERGGGIHVESAPMNGAVFRIELPVSAVGALTPKETTLADSDR